MYNMLFNSIYQTSVTTSTTSGNFIWALLVAIVLGFVTALLYQYKTIYTKAFVITLAMLPAVVASVIFLVNGNLGTGVAVAGAFSLVRFRSAPGGAKEIYAIFLAMAIGLATGMGYIGFAFLFTFVMAAVGLLYEHFDFGHMKNANRQLMITIPESLDYEEIFDDIFHLGLAKADLLSVRTSDMGSLFRLKYLIQLNGRISEKQLMDMLRERNGNLEIAISRNFTKDNEL
ncbi:TPA: DUF4956 domain-containing protein [Streptococcus suis]